MAPPLASPARHSGDAAQTLFHYTDDAGLDGILSSNKLNPSMKANNPNDARYGDGQYFSDFIQLNLFEQSKDNAKLMQVHDAINKKYGVNTSYLASSKAADKWHMRRAFLSPQFTTKWSDIPKFKCN